jgi:DNA-binding CsgD family transcriptional regulator
MKMSRSDRAEYDKSSLERSFDTQFIRLAQDLPEPYENYRFAAPRNFRFDRAWPDYRVAVELEGTRPRAIRCHNCGTEVRAIKGDGTTGEKIRLYGWHQRFSRFKSDKEKYNLAVELGWYVLRFFHDDVHADPFSMIETVRKVLQSRQYCVRLTEKLTSREDQVLHLVAAGYTGAEMGERLNISEQTIKAHIDKFRSKLVARNRASAVARAACWGLLDLGRIPWPEETPKMLAIYDDEDE